ncbi:hypothetical protein NDU88_005439 [Pleurodeles waltl]|uniref:Uncharacterized protein n=1 Tax=Pleurodeles waltl TaxID=8319 RepID=A0AAV7MEL6_PLEWA|nr:hypothetical protein NDU88_005439 [Pleurodeles waltl]
MSRLSDNAAPGAAETETVFRSCGRDDDVPGCWDNADAGSQQGNPDVRVPEKTTREDRLCARGAQEVKNADIEEPEKGDEENKSEDGNSGVPLQTDNQPWEKNNAAKRDIRHVPGGTWLTKSRSWDGVCSRLSDNAAPGTAETEMVFRSCGRDDDAPGCCGNADAGSQPGNPDVWVPEKTTREDGLCARGAQEVKNADIMEPRKTRARTGTAGFPYRRTTNLGRRTTLQNATSANKGTVLHKGQFLAKGGE